jgi:hypothetical protein
VPIGIFEQTNGNINGINVLDDVLVFSDHHCDEHQL